MMAILRSFIKCLKADRGPKGPRRFTAYIVRMEPFGKGMAFSPSPGPGEGRGEGASANRARGENPHPPRFRVADASRRRFSIQERRPKAAYRPLPDRER